MSEIAVVLKTQLESLLSGFSHVAECDSETFACCKCSAESGRKMSDLCCRGAVQVFVIFFHRYLYSC